MEWPTAELASGVGEIAADLITAGDYDGDGLHELALATFDSCSVQIFKTHAGRLTLTGQAQLPGTPIALASGDLDGDGRDDLVAALLGGRVAILLSVSGGGFAAHECGALQAPPTDIAVVPRHGAAAGGVFTAGAGQVGVVHPPRIPERAKVGANGAVEAALDRLAAFAARPAALGVRGQLLTRREAQVVELSLRGLSAGEVGRHLFIGERTVETHLARAYRKLGVGSRMELLLTSKQIT